MAGILRHLFLSVVCLLLFGFASECALAQPAPHVHRVVRNITVEVREVFDEQDIGTPYKVANALKASTREELIRRELLFKEGDKIDDFLIQESERNLRALSFVHQVSITPIRRGEELDVIVSVQDTWTLFPVFSFTSGGGSKKSSYGIVEKNLLGYGKRVEALYLEDEDRKTIEGVWDDRRLFGGYHRLLLGHSETSDGYRNVSFIGRPFRSFVEEEAWGVTTDFYDLVEKLYEAGDERYIYRHDHSLVRGGYTFSNGDPETRIQRYTLGYGHNESKFTEADEEDFVDADVDPDSVSTDPALLPKDRIFSGPIFQIQRAEPDYISINYLDRFERVEDFNLGREYNFGIQFAADWLGSRENAGLLSASVGDGHRFSPTSFLRGGIGVFSRAESSQLNDSIIRTDLKYYNVLGALEPGGWYLGKHTLASSIIMDIGEDLDLDREFALGAGNGLRGYKDRTFTGAHRLIINLEDRMHFTEDLFRLFSLGGAVFFDAGGTSESSMGDLLKDQMYADVGFGLRIGIPRSSGGTVVRIDVAFPLREGPDESGVFEPRFLFSTGQVFSPNLRTESFSLAGPDVSVGAIR